MPAVPVNWYVVVCTDTRPQYRAAYGAALATDGFYAWDMAALVQPVKFRAVDHARESARQQIALTRAAGDGKGFGVMHSVMLMTKWLAWNARRGKPSQKDTEAFPVDEAARTLTTE